MRVAYASPLAPSSSGIADYSMELLPALARQGLEIVAYFEGAAAPPASTLAGIECRPIAGLERYAETHDRIVYQLGNSAGHHAAIYRMLLRQPGIVVLHEYMLHHLVKALTLDAGRPAEYVEEMRYCAGAGGEAAARRLLDSHRPLDIWSYPLFERVVDRSRSVVVHSEFARSRIRASRAAADVRRVAFPVDLARLDQEVRLDREQARAALGVPADSFVLASFGFVTPHKRLEPALAAFARLRREVPGAQFLICGEVSAHYDLEARIRELGVEGVRVTGRLPLAEFHATMSACDLAVNLRFPTGGETSASLLRLLALSIPTVVSDLGSFTELPEGVVARVAIDELEEEHLLHLFRAFAHDPELRRTVGSAARRFVEREHSLEAAAEQLAAAIRDSPAHAVVGPAPPLGARLPARPSWQLAADLGSDLAELGVDERDEAALGAVAATLGSVGWLLAGDGSGSAGRRGSRRSRGDHRIGGGGRGRGGEE